MHVCHQELTWLAWIIGSGSLVIGYLIARVRCWWKHVRSRCPSCETGRIVTSLVRKHWTYGDPREPVSQVPITAVIPVNSCPKCGFEYEDHRAERIRNNAVTMHLKTDGTKP